MTGEQESELKCIWIETIQSEEQVVQVAKSQGPVGQYQKV